MARLREKLRLSYRSPGIFKPSNVQVSLDAVTEYTTPMEDVCSECTIQYLSILQTMHARSSRLYAWVEMLCMS